MNRIEREEFSIFLDENEDFLIERILNYALKNGYTKYTSTLKEAWKASIQGLSEEIKNTVANYINPPFPYANMIFDDNPLNNFGITEAINHRKRGVSLELFLGLYKYYFRSYIDLTEEYDMPASKKKEYQEWIRASFWYIEISYLREWTDKKNEELLDELRNTNVYMTNEKNKYLTVFESLASPVILLDDKYEIININNSASKLFFGNDTPGDIYYGNIELSNIKKDLTFFLKEIKGKKVSETSEIEMDTYDGRKIFDIKTKKMLDVSKKFNGLTLIFNDITQRKVYEEQLKEAKKEAEAADKAKSVFLANMSHELRTPITGVIGLINELENTKTDETQQKYISMLKSSSKLLLFIINDLLDYMRLESDKLVIREDIVDFREILREVFNLFEFRCNEKNLFFHHHVESDLPQNIIGDEYGIKQILMNLLGNALKFTKKGGITVNAYRCEEYSIVIEIIDTGIGIDKRNLKSIFERFFQEDSSYRKEFQGTGLGLSIVKKLIEKMHGKIEIESEKEKGSKFTVKLKLKESDKKPEKIPIKKVNLSDIKILVAEDNEIVGFLLNKSLKDRGADSTLVENGKKAVDIFQSLKPDIVILDGQMPVMSGFEAANHIRNKIGDKNIPIIALSGFTFDEEIKKFEEAKVNLILSKPIDLNLLANHILKLINDK